MVLYRKVGPVCVCLSPCTKKCNICGDTLCSMVKHFKNNCDTCSKWFFKEMFPINHLQTTNW